MALPLLDCHGPLAGRRGRRRDKPRRSVFVYIPNGVNGMAWQVTQAGPRLRTVAVAASRWKSIATTSPSSAGCIIRTGSARPTSAPTPGSPARRSTPRARGNTRTPFPCDQLMAEVTGSAHAVSVAGALDQLRHRASAELGHAGLFARRRAVAGRGQSAPRSSNRLFGAGAGRHRRATGPPGQAPQRAGCGVRRRQFAAAATWARTTARSSTNICTRSATSNSGPPGSIHGWTCPSPTVDKKLAAPFQRDVSRSRRPANTGARCST